MASLRNLVLSYFNQKIAFSFEEENLTNLAKKKPVPMSINERKLKIVIDVESCMDRLTCGYYPGLNNISQPLYLFIFFNKFNSNLISDWQSGGQWKKISKFYQDLNEKCSSANIEFVFFFDGTMHNSFDLQDWHQKQSENSKRISRIFNSNGELKIQNWIQPAFATQSIIFEINPEIFEKLGEKPVQKEKFLFSYYTHQDHKKEIIEYCAKFKCDCLLTNDFEIITLFVILNGRDKYPNLKDLNIYSAVDLKLSNSGLLTSKRINIEAILRNLNLSNEQFGWFSILLGTRWIPEQSLNTFHEKLANLKIENQVFIKNFIFSKFQNKKFFFNKDLAKLCNYKKSCRVHIF